MAFSLTFMSLSISQFSANWRMGLENTNSAAWMRSPVFCEISTMGTMSFSTVPRRAVRVDGHLLARDLAGEGQDVVVGVRPRRREPDRIRIHAEAFLMVQDLELVLDGRVGDRWGLQTIAERFVVEFAGPLGGGLSLIPFVDQFVVRWDWSWIRN